MFDSVLRRTHEPTRRMGLRAALSFGAHAVAFAGLVWISTGERSDKPVAPEVTFFNPHGKGAPGAPALQQGNPESLNRTAPAAAVKQKNPFARRNPNAKPTAGRSDDDPYGADDGKPGGSPFGEKGGNPEAGSPSGSASAAPPPAASSAPPEPKNVVIPFGPGMERPKKLSGPDPVYTKDARDANVEGKMLVSCVITTDGKLSGCSVLKGLPFMDKAVLSALAQQRWSPATVAGQPVAVTFTIPFHFKLKD